MSNFIRPWDTNTESQEQEQATSKRSLFDNIGDAITAIGANFNEVRGSERLGDLRDELMNSGALSDAEYETLKNKYIQESAERQAARDTYKTAHNNLVADDSFFKNVDQLGGTLEGMAAQGIGTAVGAGLGFLSPVVGGTAMGAKIGNAAGAVAGGYLDARSVALQAEEDVLNNGGTWEQAKRAYDETLKKASLTTLPETLVDIAMGNRLVGSALNSRAARKIAGSTLGRMGSSVLDPAAKIGTQAAFKSGSTLVGRGAGILADTALQGSTEALQEVTQDYIGNREVAKAMGQTDNEYSLGGFKDFALSDQGIETMKTAGIMGALFGGVGGTLSSGQYLTRGAETNTGIRAHNNTEKMINDGTLKIDKERRQDEEKIISALTGISPTELATWSDADIVAEASILEGQYMGVTGEAEDMATTRGAADVVRRLTSKEDNTIHREGDVTETSRAFLKGMGVDDKMLEGMFNSPAEKSIIEKARREEEQAARQEKTGEKQQTTGRFTSDTAESMRQNEGKSAIENIKEEAQQNKTEIATENTPSNNLGSAAKQQEQQGKIDTSDNIEYKDSLPGNWEADPQEFEKDAMLDQQSYYNANTNKKAVIARATDGGFNVVTDLNEERGDTPHFNTLEAAENYLTGKQNDINFQESNGEQTKEGTTEDPNIVPKGGVDARGNSHSGELINSVDDLFNFMQQNPGIIGRGEFIEFVHAKHNLGVNDLNMYLDRKNEGRVYNEQTGQWGYVNAKKFHDEATGRAMIQLYRGGDIISAVHEIAHIGYENLSVQDKTTFNRYAVKSMGQWIADMLDVNYDDALRQRLHNLQNDEELRKKIEDSPALRQTVIAFLNAEQNGVDLNHLTADQIRAIDERWAWEFSMWYTEGYMRGVEPQNILQRIYQRGIFSLGRELNMLNRLWEHIHHKDNQDIENLYTGRRNQTEERVTQEEEIINPFEAPPVAPQQATQQAAPVVTPVEQTVQQQAPVTPPVEQAQAPVPQEQPQVVQTQTQTEPVQEKPKNNKRQKQPKQPKEPKMTEQELNEQKWRVETGKFLKQFELAKPKQIEQSDADRLNGIINQIKEHPELDKSQGISKRISSILKKFFDQNAQPAQQEQTQEQVQEKPQTAEQTTPVTETSSVQQPKQAPQQGEKGTGLVPAQNLTNQNKNATVKQKQEVANNGKAEDTRGTENLRTDVGEVQGGGSVRQGNDNRTGEGRVGQDAVEGRSEGNGENLSLLKNSKFKSVYNARKEKKTELKDWRDLSGDDKLKQVFVDALNKSKEADSQHGVYVDSKTVEELKDCKVILHKNKMAGFAITSDGNIVGVFSNPKNPIRGILNDMIFIAHMMGGNRMDCFGKFLLRGYRNCGFTPVARTSFAEEYYPADNPANATIRKEKPDVYFLVKDNDNNNTYLNKVENDVYMNDAIDADSVYHIDSEDSYGDALGFQGQVLEEIQKKENKNKSTKEVADSLRPKEETATETQEITETQEQNTSVEKENPSTTEEQTEQDQTSEERKEDLLNYTNYPEEFATREEALKSVDDEKVLNEKDKQEVIDYINEWYDEIEGKQKPETTEKQVEEEQKPKQEQTTKEEETSDIDKKVDEMLENRRRQREEKGLEEESPEQIKEIREQYKKFFMLSNQNKTTKGKTTKTNKTNKTTKSKTKQADPLAELHKKYKNITGTPIGEKGYRFKDDEKQFITAFKQNIDGAVGNKEELLKVSKQLDGWFQNNPTERNRMVRKYLSNYLVDVNNIKVDDGVRNQESNFSQTIKENEEHEKRMLENRFPGVRFQLAGHASRSDFDVFSLEHFGEGEGESVAGYGIYLAKRWRTIKNYYNLLKGDFAEVTINGKKTEIPLRFMYEEMKNIDFKDKTLSNEDIYELLSETLIYSESIYKKPITSKEVVDVLKERIKDEVGIYNQLNYLPATNPEKLERMKYIRQLNQFIRKIQDRELDINFNIKETGNATIYFVDAPSDDVLIHGSKPLKEQPIIVQNGIKKAFIEAREETIKALKQDKESTNKDKKMYVKEITKMSEIDNDKMQNAPGSVLYEYLQSILSYNRKYVKRDEQGRVYNSESEMLQKKATSEILNKYGIEGISYYGTDTGSEVHNYEDKECLCIFNTKSLKILDKIKRQDGKLKSVLNKKKDDGTRFQAAPVRLIGMNENELNEQYYKDYMKIGKQLGYDIMEVEKSFLKYSHGLKDTNINTKSEPLAQIFVKVNDKINKQLWSKGKNIQRGLDGKWRFYIDDRNASIKNGVSKLLSDPDKINGRKFALGQLIKHDELFKYYPKLKSVMVEFKNLGKAKGESKGKNISSGIKINQYKIADTNDLMRTLLHEIQHNIQSEEGFARGGNSSEFLDSDSTVLFSALTDDVLSDRQKIVDFAIDNEYPITQKTIDKILDMNESDFKKYWEQNSTLGVILNDYVESNARHFEAYQNLLGEIEARDASNRFGMSDEEYKKQKPLNYVYAYRRLRENNNEVTVRYQESSENRENREKVNDIINRAREGWKNGVKKQFEELNNDKNIKLIFKGEITKASDIPIKVRSVEELLKIDERYPDAIDQAWNKLHKFLRALSNLNGDPQKVSDYQYQTISDKESREILRKYDSVIDKFFDKKIEMQNNDTRYQESAKQDKSEEREEKEYNKRKERVEKAKEEGTLSDQMKDVYSVSFTKSAQEYAENRTKMEYFDNNEDYWDRTEDKSTGKVTYVRKTPYEHQQKVVTYNGVNDVKRENKKKSKPAQWMEWMKDQVIKYMFNDKHYLAKAARKLGVYDAYRRMIVTEGYALKANTALTQGIKYNGKTTRALNDIIRDVGEPKQKEFLKYCIAHRILDLKDRENPVFQKMKPDEARRYIEEIKASPDAELFERNRKDFVEYNKALLHVLVDGGIMDEKTFQKFCEVDPNFVPLTKVMDDADMGFSSIINAHNLVNLKSPIKKIGTSMLEVANPFLEMQKRTAEYYAIASRNKAGQIFVNEIAGALEKTTGGDVIARGQGMLRRVRVDERNGQLITKPDDKQQIIYVCNNGKHEFYQVADREIYQALTFMNADQMGTIHKMLDKIAHVPSGLVRETATMVPDFGVRNVIRDGGEAFLTSEHGFLPVIDQIWGMWQVMNNTEWAQMYFNQNGEYGTLNRDKVNSEGIASVDDVIDEKLNPLKNFKEIKQAQMAILKDKQRQFSILTDIKDGNFGDAWEHARKSRGVAALKLAISPLWAIGKSNKRMNDLFELGTRVGEFKNAKMGFEGTLDRIARGIMNTNLKEAEFQKKAQSDVYAAHVAKDITLNFSQHGKLGKELNRYIPFFNASLQGIYKLCNTLQTMATGTTTSGGKNRRLQQELLFKAALITAMAVGVAAAGDGDEDYEEAPDYEKENFWILPNGLRFPKDQVLGKIIGNTVEKSYAQWKKGKAEPSTILKSILENFKPDRFMFAIFDLAIGGFGNYDTFKERSIVPEYMADKLGHLQKDISTSNFAVDVSEALWKCGFDISAKKIDWALQKNFSNCAKYATAIYDLGKKSFNPKEFNERIARGYDKNDSTGSMVAGLKDDIPSPFNLVSGTFATNRSTFKSISDFYENYKKYKKLSSDEASMSKEDKRMWKRYEQAYKKDMVFRKQLRAIKQDRTLTGKQKREKADKIFKQQIKLAKWAEG